MRWTHCALETKNFNKTLQFYMDFCQMNIVKDRVDNGRRVIWLVSSKSDYPVLVLAEVMESEMKDSRCESMLRHFGFELSSRKDVDAIYKKLIGADFYCTKPFFIDMNTGYVCMTKDPDGRWVEFSHGQDVIQKNSA